jgi:hypothetical protein
MQVWIKIKGGLMIKLAVNEKEYKADAGPDVPLLWVIRK